MLFLILNLTGSVFHCRCGLKTDVLNVANNRRLRRGNPSRPLPRRPSLPLPPPPLPCTVSLPWSAPLPLTWWRASHPSGVPLRSHPLTTFSTPTVACRGAVTQCQTLNRPPIPIKTMDLQVTIVTWATSTICNFRWCQIKWTKWTGIRSPTGPCQRHRSRGPIPQTV